MLSSQKKRTGNLFSVDEYDKVLFSQDPVILTILNDKLCVLLVKREQEPCKGQWGLPGGRVDKERCSDLWTALAEKLKQKTGLENIYFEQVFTEGGADMDPRGWSVTTVYMALVRHEDVPWQPNEMGEALKWWPVDHVNDAAPLAFWHERLIERTITRLRNKVIYLDLPMYFMPEKFSIKALREAYEVILGRPLSRQAFDKRVRKANILVETGEETHGNYRPAELYRYIDRRRVHHYSGELKAK